MEFSFHHSCVIVCFGVAASVEQTISSLAGVFVFVSDSNREKCYVKRV